MYIRTLSLLTLTVLAVAVSTSCGDKKDEPGVPVKSSRPVVPALVPGITQNLTRNEKPATYHLDRIGPINNPVPKQTFQLAGDASTEIVGWAIDTVAKKVAGGVEVLIDSSAFTAHAGMNRTDVADYFKRPDYITAGFDLTLPPGQLTKGEHSISIRVIANDKKSYYQGDLLNFVVN